MKGSPKWHIVAGGHRAVLRILLVVGLTGLVLGQVVGALQLAGQAVAPLSFVS